MNVLIGYDGSESAHAAITGLRSAGLPPDSRVLVVSVADVWPDLTHPRYELAGKRSGWHESAILRNAHALVADARAEARAFAAEGEFLVRSEHPDWDVSHEVYDGSSYLTLIDPPKGSVDLVIVGAHNRSPLERFVLGSVSQKVLAHAASSVRVSRECAASSGSNSPLRVIVGVDGSGHSALAVNAVANRYWPARSEVKVVAVLDTGLRAAFANHDSSILASSHVPVGAGEAGCGLHRAVTAAADRLSAAGLIPTTLIEKGDPKRILVEVAEQWKADCIFVGASGHGRVENLLLGSVSAAVATRSDCSVEVVRAA